MSAFKISIINDGSTDIKDLSISWKFDDNMDLKRFESPKNKSFLEQTSDSIPKICPKNKYNSFTMDH